MSPKGVDIYFSDDIQKSNFEHVCFEGVAKRNVHGEDQYYISDYQGYVAYVNAVASSVKSARAKAEKLADQIYFPRMFYRHDIGLSFIEDTFEKLCEWGYVDSPLSLF